MKVAYTSTLSVNMAGLFVVSKYTTLSEASDLREQILFLHGAEMFLAT